MFTNILIHKCIDKKYHTIKMSSSGNTLSVLSSMTPSVPKPTIPLVPTNSVPLSSTSLSPARLTGLVAPNAQVVPSDQTVSVPQTINSPQISMPRPSPRVTMVQSVTTTVGNTPVQISLPQSSQVSLPQAPVSPSRATTLSGTPVQVTVSQGQSSPTARSALLNLSNVGMQQPSVMIPSMATAQKQESLLFPSIKVNTPASVLPVKPSAEIMNQEFEVRDYQGIIANSSLENELLNAGYAPLSKIVIRTDSGDKRTQYIKAINKKGQKVFIMVDVNGYTTARSTDLTLIEAHNASIVPYSLKTGAYNCAGKDVCGVAFECGSDAVCVLSRGATDLTPKEANFVFVEQSAPAAASVEIEGTIMTYPVVRLSEIRANPSLVLANTDTVTRRLRNTSYTAELQELALAQQSINKLSASFVEFNKMREEVAVKLNRTLTQLEQWNDIYIASPPMTDDAKDRYRKLQFNLAQRNEGIATLLRSVKKVADKRVEIDAIAQEIYEITEFCKKEFANVEYATSE
jgi:hypothetical protein